MSARRFLLGLALIPAAAGMVPARALAQEATKQIPAVQVHPVGTTRNDPNGGQWFVTTLNPMETKTLQVRLYNPADVAQTVKVYLTDIRFDSHGIPEVLNESSDIGTWGKFDELQVVVQPKQSLIQSLSIMAPEGADPGDHVGAVVAEQAPQGTGPVQSIKRLAVRLYATLPGDAKKDFVIDKVDAKKDSAFLTRELAVSVRLRNTGRVRLEPAVQVDGKKATGPTVLLAQASERYVVTRKVGFFGGPVRLRIDAQTRSLGLAGPVRQQLVTIWVIPWHLFASAALVAGIGFAGRFVLRRRRGKYDSIRSDIRRLERLLSVRAYAPDDVEHAATNGNGSDPRPAVREAIKQARRAGDEPTAARLEAKLAESEEAELERPREDSNLRHPV